MNDFTHRSGVALVVGATGGIGAAIARMLAARGARVALTFRSNGDAAAELVSAIGEPARAWQLDVTDEAACARVVGEVAETFGGIHTLCHAAGPHVPMVHLSRVSPAQFRSQLEQDTIGFFNVLSPTIAHLRASRGSIVAVTTAATDRTAVRDGLSLTPKGAVEALVRGIAAEEGRFGIRANMVGPGMLTDGMAERLIASGDLDDAALAAATTNIPMRRFGRAEDIAELVCFLASDRAGYISGQKVNVDGGYTA
ncbi:3-oxoacyl-ACP reductase [Rhizocola hellebori]|uniref:3-oxoacyl-ACP reductase n=1 Tax=Rhizocola hellebori TaxID=1392758 RepID=A0A8J3VI58_9ACTN|nr:SDR family oxidoreductase [Rhizocola hellebori]GIH06686.1 3-oxoacyl-ACP reductase [Rhizocola hellebori]